MSRRPDTIDQGVSLFSRTFRPIHDTWSLLCYGSLAAITMLGSIGALGHLPLLMLGARLAAAVFVVSVWPVVWRYLGAVDVAAGPWWAKALFTLSLIGVTVVILAITLSFALQLPSQPFPLLEMLLGGLVLTVPSGFVLRLATARRDARQRA